MLESASYKRLCSNAAVLSEEVLIDSVRKSLSFPGISAWIRAIKRVFRNLGA